MNTTTTKTLNEIKANFSEVTTNVIDGMDLGDYNHQCADGDENVIYYHKAWAKINNATSEQLEDAEDQFKETGMEFEDLNKLMTVLSFYITLEEIAEQHEQEIKEDLQALITLAADIEQEDLDDDYDQCYELIEKLEEVV